MNIISNAAETIEASGGGVLRLETRYLEKSERIAVIFKDTGIVIPKENISKIFEPFFTTRAPLTRPSYCILVTRACCLNRTAPNGLDVVPNANTQHPMPT